jgi:hypothetical protein
MSALPRQDEAADATDAAARGEALMHDPERVFYNDGLADGMRDGVLGGKAEGRSIGLKAGFEKFVEAGRLAGRAVVWARQQQQTPSESSPGPSSTTTARLAPLPGGSRLAKNVEAVYALVDPATLSTENTDETVDDFDDRLKRAQGKTRVVMRSLDGKGGESEAGRGESTL